MEENKVNIPAHVIMIGGSAGSLEVLLNVLPRLTSLNNKALIIVVHRKGSEDTLLEGLIAMKTHIPVYELDDKVPVLPGYIYIAPSDYHLLFEKDYTLALDASEKINYSRPSIDVAFESAAEVYGNALTAILVSGANADGTNGLIAIQKAGGIVAIQNPETAEMPFMPKHALEHIEGVKVLDTNGISNLIMQ
ncbi:chemotaxis protein CheB [Flavobacterium rhizosphaerae]|uniref:protein-glutamate methylesterase n=1 Tax=Flavobacterium rhizosphaerae TaxID=3163298 RepID=A0ABW8Z288_9FLAO